jgi:hypothetical protein
LAEKENFVGILLSTGFMNASNRVFVFYHKLIMLSIIECQGHYSGRFMGKIMFTTGDFTNTEAIKNDFALIRKKNQ